MISGACNQDGLPFAAERDFGHHSQFHCADRLLGDPGQGIDYGVTFRNKGIHFAGKRRSIRTIVRNFSFAAW